MTFIGGLVIIKIVFVFDSRGQNYERSTYIQFS